MVARNSEAFLDIAAQVLARGHRVRFVAEGDSMRPTLRGGEALIVAPVVPPEVGVDDILLYRAGNRAYVHRVIAIGDESRRVFTLRGDADDAVAEHVPAEQVLGRVVAIQREGPGKRLVLHLKRAAGRLGKLGDGGVPAA